MQEDESYRSTANKVIFFVWIFSVLLSTVFLVMGGQRNDTLIGIWFSVLACFLLTTGATLLINHVTNRRSQDVLGELAALKQRLQELQDNIERRRD